MRPHTLITFDPWASYEENPDHLKAAHAAEEAAWMAGLPSVHPEHLRAGMKPHSIVDRYYWARGPHLANRVEDISAFLERKLEAVRAHRGMIRDPQILVDLRAANARLGELHQVAYAEVFHYERFGKLEDYLGRHARPARSPR